MPRCSYESHNKWQLDTIHLYRINLFVSEVLYVRSELDFQVLFRLTSALMCYLMCCFTVVQTVATEPRLNSSVPNIVLIQPWLSLVLYVWAHNIDGSLYVLL
jgi:hypothetical protein